MHAIEKSSGRAKGVCLCAPRRRQDRQQKADRRLRLTFGKMLAWTAGE